MPGGLFPTAKGEGLSDRKVLILIFAALLIPGLLWVFLWPFNPGDRARVEQLRRLAAELPVYPDSKEVNWYGGSRSDHSRLTVYYDVPAYSASFETVKKFYTDALTRQGWSYSGEEAGVLERSVSFRKDIYSITVSHKDGEYSDWDYAVSLGWRH